jgi:hypothetical protein
MKRTPNTGPLTEQEKKHVQKLFEGMDKAELRNMTQVLREVYVKGASQRGEPINLAVMRNIRNAEKKLGRG